MTTRTLAKKLKEAGIEVVEIYESVDEAIEDDAITLKDGYHIQVGCNYASLNKEEGEGDDWGVMFGEIRTREEDIIADAVSI